MMKMRIKELRSIINEELTRLTFENKPTSKKQSVKQSSKKIPEFDSLNKWDDFPSDISLSGDTGVGPGEYRLADILGGKAQGQSKSYDLSIPDGPFEGNWEVKAPDKDSEIRPGTEGSTAFGHVNKTLRIAFDELQEFITAPGIENLMKGSGTSSEYQQIVTFMNDSVTKSGKSNYDLLQRGEITAARFNDIMKIIEAASKIIKSTQGKMMNVKVNNKSYKVTPTNMLKISRLLGITEDEASNELGDASSAAIALSILSSPVFSNPDILKSQWEETITAEGVFDLTGVILVTPEGFMMIRHPYGDQIKFSRVSQGKPKFKVPVKGQSGKETWG